jgi:hypothetical protein
MCTFDLKVLVSPRSEELLILMTPIYIENWLGSQDLKSWTPKLSKVNISGSPSMNATTRKTNVEGVLVIGDTSSCYNRKKYKPIDYISSLVRSLNCWFVSTG